MRQDRHGSNACQFSHRGGEAHFAAGGPGVAPDANHQLKERLEPIGFRSGFLPLRPMTLFRRRSFRCQYLSQETISMVNYQEQYLPHDSTPHMFLRKVCKTAPCVCPHFRQPEL
jgi:hypothetical protein